MTRVGTTVGLLVLLFLSQVFAQQRGLTEAQLESAEYEVPNSWSCWSWSLG